MNRVEKVSIDQDMALDDTAQSACNKVTMKTASDQCNDDTTPTSFSLTKQSNDDATGSDIMDGNTGNYNLTFIRQRNAIYSKRKYYKKKRYIEQLKSSKYRLEACNRKMKESNERLELMLQRAKETVEINERSAVIIAQDQKRLQNMLLLHHQHPVQASSANDTMVSLQQFYSQADHRIVEKVPSTSSSAVSIQSLATAGVKTAITRQVLQRGLAAQNRTLLSPPVPNIASQLSTLQDPYHDVLSNYTSLSNPCPPLSQIEMLLLQHELDKVNANNMESSQNQMLSALLNERSRANDLNEGNSSIAMMQYLKSLQDQETLRNTVVVQQILWESERELERQSVASVMAANVTAAQSPNMTLLQRLFLSTGRNS